MSKGGAMSPRQSIAITCLAVLALGLALPAGAQTAPPLGEGPAARPRIQVYPRPVYRRCASWYVIQYRPSGTVLFPEKHCWWQR